jgi:hypothetical protein
VILKVDVDKQNKDQNCKFYMKEKLIKKICQGGMCGIRDGKRRVVITVK